MEKGFVTKDVLLTKKKRSWMALKKHHLNIAGDEMDCTFASTVPVLHTIRTAGGSFFWIHETETMGRLEMG